MLLSAVLGGRIAPSAASASAVAALLISECDRDRPRVALPRPEVHVIVRFGSSVPGGIDVHALGVRQRAYRKLIRRGHRFVIARLRLGAHEAALGVPVAALANHHVTLDALWGERATRRLLDGLADAPDLVGAATVLERAIAERLLPGRSRPRAGAQLAVAAAARLATAPVRDVADEMGVSERHLRRLFRETVGVSPKTFARLSRFQRALHAARSDDGARWAGIATAAGYYDQAHLIADFRALTGATPQALLRELDAASFV